MAEWSIRSDEGYQRLLSALERAVGKGTKIHIIDKSTPTKHVDEYLVSFNSGIFFLAFVLYRFVV